ncbi:MAG: NUDIX domain-containing protein [Flavobacteriales bacterium]|jgi:ADP-ribose pyrophosphatase YjhB (NUDIX family)|nr:NUDIX domain-containing protein [Flavobacteriales bacterium]
MNTPRFTIRAYGLLLHEGAVLVSDEHVQGRAITKFPGGALEYGEGLRDCLVREVREEVGVEALDVRHFHTTEVFQRSAFHTDPVQVVAVYFTFRTARPEAIPVVRAPFGGGPGADQVFRWLPLAGTPEDAFSLPLDRAVWRLLRHRAGWPPSA